MPDEDDVPLQVLVATVSDHYDADIFVYSGEIGDEGFGKLIEVVLRNKVRDNIVLVLTTNGGSGNNAYQIARFIHKVYKKFYLYTPSYCKSAGTLIALGAHELIMDTFSELGPLDVQLLKRNELGVRKSGLLTRSAFEGLSESSFELFETLMMGILRKSGGLISFQLASKLSAEMASSLMSGIYSRIDPETVGSDRRDLEVAIEYGNRLVFLGENASFGVVHHLVHHYPSHDFIIDDEEARSLFQNVSYPIHELMMLSGFLGKVAYDDGGDLCVVSMDELSADAEGEDNGEGVKGDGEGESEVTEDGVDPSGVGRDDRAGDPAAEASQDGPEERAPGQKARPSRRGSGSGSEARQPPES